MIEYHAQWGVRYEHSVNTLPQLRVLSMEYDLLWMRTPLIWASSEARGWNVRVKTPIVEPRDPSVEIWIFYSGLLMTELRGTSKHVLTTEGTHYTIDADMPITDRIVLDRMIIRMTDLMMRDRTKHTRYETATQVEL